MTTATVPASWTQSQGCLTSGDYWGWSIVNLYADVLGAPTDSTACYPPGFSPTKYMYGNECPDGFTSACGVISGFTSEAITCCPTAYQFTCSGSATEMYLSPFASLPCRSDFASVTEFSFTITNLASSTETFTSASRDTNAILHAMGVELRPIPSSTTSPMTTSFSTTTPPSSISTQHHSSSLPTGTSAGIGVGVGLAVILLTGLAWFIYRYIRRQSNRKSQYEFSSDPSTAQVATTWAVSELSASKAQQLHELPARSDQRYELASIGSQTKNLEPK